MKKASLCLLLLFTVIFLASCSSENVNGEKEGNTESPNTKIVTDENTIDIEEPFQIVQSGKVLNLCINVYNRDFRDLYDDNSYTKYFDYEKSFLPYVEIEKQFDEYNVFYKIKAYQRKTYSVDKDGNTIIIDNSLVNRTLHTFKITVQNDSGENITYINLPMLKVIFEDSDGNQFFDKNTYTNENGETEFSMMPVYLEPSDNYDTKVYSDYLSTTINADSTNDLTLKYVLDNDLYTSAYLCFNSETGDKYFKLY